MPISYDLYVQHDELGNAPHLLSAEDKALIDSGDTPRVCGQVICVHCGREYNDHPEVIGALWLTKLCDGRIVKL